MPRRVITRACLIALLAAGACGTKSGARSPGTAGTTGGGGGAGSAGTTGGGGTTGSAGATGLAGTIDTGGSTGGAGIAGGGGNGGNGGNGGSTGGAVDASADVAQIPFQEQVLEIAATYTAWGRVDDELRWAPFLCRAPYPGIARPSKSDDESTHGRKLYSVFAKNHASYPDGPQDGQVVVKQSWVPELVDTDAGLQLASYRSDAGTDADHFYPYAQGDGGIYRAGTPAGLFIMFRLDPATPDTDEGWVYATVSAAGQVTAAGRVANCMGCHETSATHERLFGDALVLQEVAAGLTKYLPDYPMPMPTPTPTGGRIVRLRNLLTHTSGIHNYTDGDYVTRRATQAETPEALVASFRDKPFDFEPGTRWAYSNSNYVVLGLILERVTSKRYADLLAERITRPLGLTSTFYCGNQPTRPEEAEGYRVLAGRIVPALPIDMSTAFAAGGICSSVVDLAPWAYALRTGRVVPAALYAEMATPATLADGKRVPYGFGLSIIEMDGRLRVGHGGGIHGFVSHIVTFPADDMTVVVLVNTGGLAAQAGARAVARLALDLE